MSHTESSNSHSPGTSMPSALSRAAGHPVRWDVVIALVVVLVTALIVVYSSRGGDNTGGSSSTGTAAARNGVIIDEQFDGDTLDSALWNTCHWWDNEGCTITSNDELEWYLPEQVSVSDGMLHLTAAKEPVEASDGEEYPYRSGMVTTGPTPDSDGVSKRAFTYGKVETRLRVPAGRGLWPAVWLLPTTEESRPEIDVMEVIGQEPQINKMHVHPLDRDKESLGKDYQLPGGASLADGFHTLTLDWSPGLLIFGLDGTEMWRVTGDDVPSEPMYLLFNLAVGGAYPGDPDEATKFPAQFDIDYVRVTQP